MSGDPNVTTRLDYFFNDLVVPLLQPVLFADDELAERDIVSQGVHQNDTLLLPHGDVRASHAESPEVRKTPLLHFECEHRHEFQAFKLLGDVKSVDVEHLHRGRKGYGDTLLISRTHFSFVIVVEFRHIESPSNADVCDTGHAVEQLDGDTSEGDVMFDGERLESREVALDPADGPVATVEV